MPRYLQVRASFMALLRWIRRVGGKKDAKEKEWKGSGGFTKGPDQE